MAVRPCLADRHAPGVDRSGPRRARRSCPGPRHLDLMPHLPALDMWAQWDAQHYVNIAVRGYDPPKAPESNIAFFPLYPLLIRIVLIAVGRVDTQTGAFVGLVISNVALFIALLYLSALSRATSRCRWRDAPSCTSCISDDAVPVIGLCRAGVPAAAVASLYHARAGEWGRSSVAGRWPRSPGRSESCSSSRSPSSSTASARVPSRGWQSSVRRWGWRCSSATCGGCSAIPSPISRPARLGPRAARAVGRAARLHPRPIAGVRLDVQLARPGVDGRDDRHPHRRHPAVPASYSSYSAAG